MLHAIRITYLRCMSCLLERACPHSAAPHAQSFQVSPSSSMMLRGVRLLRILSVFRLERPLKAIRIIYAVCSRKREELMECSRQNPSKRANPRQACWGGKLTFVMESAGDPFRCIESDSLAWLARVRSRVPGEQGDVPQHSLSDVVVCQLLKHSWLRRRLPAVRSVAPLPCCFAFSTRWPPQIRASLTDGPFPHSWRQGNRSACRLSWRWSLCNASRNAFSNGRS